MNMPADISPELATWLRMQMTLAAARAVEPLRAELNKVDDWANGLYLALNDVMPFLLRTHPELASEIAPRWRDAAERFEQIEAGHIEPDQGESLELLEGRKMFFRMFALLKLWPTAKPQRGAKLVTVRRRA